MTTAVYKKPIRSLAIMALVSLAACEKACQSDPQNASAPANTVKTEDAAASVNGVNLAKAELDTLHQRAVDRFSRTNRQVSTELDRKMRASILRKMIDDEIIKQKAVSEGVKVDRFERVTGLERYKEKMGGQKAFNVFMQRQGLSEEQVEQTVLSDLQRDKLIEKIGSLGEITDQEIEVYYKNNQKYFAEPEKVRARHIPLKVSEQDPPQKAEAVLKKAYEVLKEAHGNKDFSELAEKYSEGPSAKQKGDLGVFTRGRMTKTFEDAAFSAPVKQAVGPIRTEYGYHIIYVEEKWPAQVTPLPQAKSKIVDLIKRNKRSLKSEEILTDLRKEAVITITDYSLTAEDYKTAHKESHQVAQDKKPEQE